MGFYGGPRVLSIKNVKTGFGCCVSLGSEYVSCILFEFRA